MPDSSSMNAGVGSNSIIEVSDLSIRYGNLPPALDGFSLSVQRGDCLLVTGPSGCGKSTLARALMGLIPHAIPARMTGEIKINGLGTRSTPIPALAEHIGLVFQNPATQLFHLTVEDEVSFGPHNLGLPPDEITRRVEWALDAVSMAEMRKRRPMELSGGQQTRLAIAAVLAMRPDILILDEPAASLDPAGAREVMETLTALKRDHRITIILIEHRLAYGASIADRMLVLDEGKIAAEGGPDEIFADLALCDRLGLRIPEVNGSGDKFVFIQDSPSPSGEPLLTLEGIHAGYDRTTVLSDIDLVIHPGEFVAFTGPNGAGKSTLSLVMAGLLKPSAGRITFDGGARISPGEDVTLLFQNPADQIFADSVDDEVAFGPRNFDTYDEGGHDALLETMGLTPFKSRIPISLSMGQAQRLTLAACLALRPRLLILDEPTLGQDWGHLMRVMSLIKEINEEGVAVVLISHDQEIVRRYAHRIIHIEEGRIVNDGCVA